MKTKKKSRKQILSLVCALAIIAMEILAAVLSWNRQGPEMFTFYTEDSNLLALAACTLYAAGLIRSMNRGEALPSWVVTLKFAATGCLTLTFVVVVVVLAPMLGGFRGYEVMLLWDSMLFHHLLCPVLMIVSTLFVDGDGALDQRAVPMAMVPTVLYAVVVIGLNIGRVLSGPYPFLMVYNQPWWASVLWTLGIVGGADALDHLLVAVKNRTASRRNHGTPEAAARF